MKFSSKYILLLFSALLFVVVTSVQVCVFVLSLLN